MKTYQFKWIVLSFIVTLVLSCAPGSIIPGLKRTENSSEGVEESGNISPDDPQSIEKIDWRAYEGQTINLFMVRHPSSDTMQDRIDQFKQLTGIEVVIQSIPEDRYFDQLTAVFAQKSNAVDGFMTNSFMLWQYSPAGYMEPLDGYLVNPEMMPVDYHIEDFYPFLLDELKWSGSDGDPTGSGNLYALPWSFQTSSLIYRKSILEECVVDVPEDLEQLYAAALKLKECKPGLIPLSVSGIRDWRTVQKSIIPWFTSYGGKDVEQIDGKLMCALNKNPASVAAADQWGKIIREVVQPNYADFTTSDVINGFLQGQSVMFIDEDVTGYSYRETSKFPDDWGIAPAPGKPGSSPQTDPFIWAIGMNAFSEKKEATWLWMVWSTSPEFVLDAAIAGTTINPPRKSVWESQDWKDRVAPFTGYLDTWSRIEPGTKNYYTPQAAFFMVTTEWSTAFQDIQSGKTAQEALDETCKRINSSLSY